MKIIKDVDYTGPYPAIMGWMWLIEQVLKFSFLMSYDEQTELSNWSVFWSLSAHHHTAQVFLSIVDLLTKNQDCANA